MSALWEGGFHRGGKSAEDPAQAEYKVRPATDADQPLAQAWIEADKDHRGKVRAPFWTANGKNFPGVESRILYRRNRPLFFFRLERTVRIHIQFAPVTSKEEQDEMRDALESGMRWLSMGLGAGGVSELIFDSTTRLLRRFVTGKLGFMPSPNELTKRLVRLPPRH